MRKVLLAGALVLAACAQKQGPIVIGIAGPFSQPRGVSMQRAAQLAADEINAQGGIQGQPLKLIFADDSGLPDVAVRVAQALMQNPQVVAVVGHLTSGTTLAAARIYGGGAHPLPMISPSASSPELSGLNPYVFRVCPSDLLHGPELARFATQTLHARRAAIIYENDDYGRGIRRTFAAEFQKEGGAVAEADPYLPSTTSLEPYLARIAAQGNVDVLLLGADRPGAELALREMATAGLHWPVLGGDALTGIEADGALAAGVHISSAYLPDRPGDRNATFVAAYARTFQGERPDHRGAGAYDAVHLLAQAVDAVGADRAAIRAYLAGVGTAHAAYDGVTGRIAFDSNGDVPAKPVVIGVVRDGRLVTEAAR